MRTFLVLAGLVLLSGCAPAAQEKQRQDLRQAYSRAVLTEAAAYVAAVRVDLFVAFVETERAIAPTPCRQISPRSGSYLRYLNVERCTASLISGDNFMVTARFTNGLAFVADQDSVRQVDVTSLPEPK